MDYFIVRNTPENFEHTKIIPFYSEVIKGRIVVYLGAGQKGLLDTPYQRRKIKKVLGF